MPLDRSRHVFEGDHFREIFCQEDVGGLSEPGEIVYRPPGQEDVDDHEQNVPHPDREPEASEKRNLHGALTCVSIDLVVQYIQNPLKFQGFASPAEFGYTFGQLFRSIGTVDYHVDLVTSRPRVLGWIRSAAILDGDWGTSIAYVLGIGFALAGYSSFWHLMAMLALTTPVAVNYITICRLYPKGGGVYSSVYGRSKTWAGIGALLLSADYVVTIALSILDAAHYFGIHDPLLAAIVIILGVGVFNWYGPKHTGAAAIFISLAAVGTLLVIMIASLPTTIATTHIERPSGTFFANWEVFVGIILSISGIEAVSNMTGLMKDPARDSRRAILSILTKVVFATVFLTLAMHA